MRQTQAPGFVEPMLLAPGVDLPSGDRWWAELKLDGARGQLRVIDGVPELRTRRGRRCDDEFREITAAAAGLPDVILDGEIVVPGDDGGPDFAALRARLGARAVRARAAATARPAVFYAFDVLWHQGIDLRRCPLFGRRRVLESLPLSGAVRLVDTHPGQAAAVLAFAREHFLEGVVVKRADSPYRSGRSAAWQKFKIRHPERVWVTAWLPGGPGELDRYWVGRQVEGRLVPSGEVSYVLTPQQAATLRSRRVRHCCGRAQQLPGPLREHPPAARRHRPGRVCTFCRLFTAACRRGAATRHSRCVADGSRRSWRR